MQLICILSAFFDTASVVWFAFNLNVTTALQHIQNFYNKTYSARSADQSRVSADNGTAAVQGSGLDDFTLTFLWSLTTTLYVIGGAFGAYGAGFVADRFGRQVEIIIKYCVHFFLC